MLVSVNLIYVLKNKILLVIFGPPKPGTLDFWVLLDHNREPKNIDIIVSINSLRTDLFIN